MLLVEAEGALTVRRCFQIVLVSLKFSIESVKCLRFAFLISLLVLLRSRLYSGQFLRNLNLSLALRASPISVVYQSGRRLDLALRCLTGACLSTCFMTIVCKALKSSSTD